MGRDAKLWRSINTFPSSGSEKGGHLSNPAFTQFPEAEKPLYNLSSTPMPSFLYLKVSAHESGKQWRIKAGARKYYYFWRANILGEKSSAKTKDFRLNSER